MSLKLHVSPGLNIPYFDLRYAPFQAAACALPDCHLYIHDYSECAGFLSKNPAFSVYVNSDSDGGGQDGTQVIGDYYLTPCGDGVAIRLDELIWVWVHEAWKRIDVVLDKIMLPSPNLHALIMRGYQYAAIHAGAILLHAAAIAWEGRGILFCGVPGAGKSTQARLWEGVYGVEAINNDQPCVIFRDGKPIVSGTPWSGKEPCYKTLKVPVRALVFVEKSPTDRVEPVSLAEAFSLLYLNEYVFPFRDETEAAYSAVLEKLVQTVPVYRQFCTMTEQAPRALHAALRQPGV